MLTVVNLDRMPSMDQTNAPPVAEQDASSQEGIPPEGEGPGGVDQPGKLLRIAMMVREMLEEVRRAPQLLGWLEGLFQGIQAAIASQQLQMASQLEEMRRRALPSGDQRPDVRTIDPNPGQYL